ncbi:hypothetical protein [Halotalea alkalilenta]|nr:hypothetical protein [Halotalea alkalilenta]
MTVPIPTTGVPGADPGTFTQAQQNLFERMAENARSSQQGVGPAELGQRIVDQLDGFISRSQAFANRAALPQVDAGSIPNGTTPAESTTQPPRADDRLAQVAESLGRVFDHSIETQMVVRGATQVSGSANTLLRGQ